MKLKQILVLFVGLLAIQAMAQDKKVESKPAAAPPDKEKISYAIGINVGSSIKQYLSGVDIDVDTLAKAIKEVLAGSTTRVTEREASDTIRTFRMQRVKEMSEKNAKEGEEFLAKKKKDPDVKVTSSGLAYKVLKEGTGPIPKATDIVVANYRGTLIDGKEFDSSYSRNQPFESSINGVIAGWKEALQLMKVGSKWELYVPSNLAYGDYGSPPKIGPKAALIFEMELLSIKEPPKPQARSTNEVVSGEIIKVPSANEMKKGAKIEVIKPGQTNAVELKK